MEQTLVFLKPDAVQRGLTGEIISRFERRGLKLVAMKLMTMTPEMAQTHYAVHAHEGFFASLLDFVTSGPIVAMVWEGPEAITVVRSTMGHTNSASAAPGTIRGDLAVEIGRNLIHGSDSGETAQKEIALFFADDELQAYTRETDRWIIEA